MRTIKFRGKRTDTLEWVYGDLLNRRIWSRRISIIRMIDDGFDTYQEAEVLSESVGQWTGIEDVYEGDIAKIFSYFYECGMQSRGYLESECKYEVVTFRDGAFYVGRTLLSNADYEIVGNIHDNPELIEVE